MDKDGEILESVGTGNAAERDVCSHKRLKPQAVPGDVLVFEGFRLYDQLILRHRNRFGADNHTCLDVYKPSIEQETRTRLGDASGQNDLGAG